MIRRHLASTGELFRLMRIGVMPWHIDPDPPELTMYELEHARFFAKLESLPPPPTK